MPSPELNGRVVGQRAVIPASVVDLVGSVVRVPLMPAVPGCCLVDSALRAFLFYCIRDSGLCRLFPEQRQGERELLANKTAGGQVPRWLLRVANHGGGLR